MNRIDRLTGILLLLQRRPSTAETIARRFEVSKRTIIRDISALRQVGVPIVSQDGVQGGYSLPADYKLAPLPLTTREMFLLLLALDAVDQMSAIPFAGERATLQAKLHTLLPTEELASVERWLRRVRIAIPRREQRAPWLETLLDAVTEQRWLGITYRSARRESQATIYPREIYAQEGFWYCRAYVHEATSERIYRVDRFVALAAVDDRSGLPAEPPTPRPYDADEHPLVVAHLTATGTAHLDTEPHLGQILRRNPDGSATLTFRCPPGELAYYARLFATLGDEIDVAAPETLREQLATLGKRLWQRYQKR